MVAAADGSSLRFSSLSAGGFHTCGVTTDGSAYCWGDNSLGALGISPLQDVSRVPVAVGSRLGGQALRFSSLSAGFAYTCGLTPQGQAYCWGFNEYGELGNHAAYTSNDPVAVVAPAKGQALRFQSIAAGEDHTCALTLNAIAYCWGRNEFGKLGNHSTTNSSLPVAVSAANRGQILRFSKLVVGDRHTCGLSSNGGAYCWGYNFPGSLGNNSTTNSSIPVAVVAAKGGNILSFSSITAGGAQTCGLTTNGSAFCWGWNRTGQLGDHTNTMSSVPVPVAAPTGEPTLNFLSLAAGSSHTCGIAVSGKAYCWGENNRAQLGNSNPKNVNIPTAVVAPKIPNLPVFSSFTVGLEHLCGLTAQGTAYCWGQNNYGQLGNSTVTASNSPVAVAAPRGEPTLSFSSLTAGAYHTCGLISKGKAYCWGAGGHGALGNAADRNSSIPVVVLSPTQNALPFTSLSAGYGFSCGITLVGSAYCWGDNAFGKLGTTSTTYTLVATPVASPNGGTPLVFQHISTGYDHACGLASNGAAYCWGLNRDGGLGDGSTSDSSLPVAVVAPTGEARLKFSSISAGAGLSCGLTVTGAAYCWGDNTFGGLGNNSTISSSLPVRVAVPRGIKSLSFLSISTGANHSCALTSSGKAYCWGWNKFGALGNGNTTNSSIPVPVKTLGSESGSSLLKLIASGFRTCGLSVRGKIRCW